jgi:hypothetical protein
MPNQGNERSPYSPQRGWTAQKGCKYSPSPVIEKLDDERKA